MMLSHLDITTTLWEDQPMRTTLTIDDDLLAAAKSLAQSQSVTVGRVLSDLARRGLTATSRLDVKADTGFPVFEVPPDARPITLEDVQKLGDEM